MINNSFVDRDIKKFYEDRFIWQISGVFIVDKENGKRNLILFLHRWKAIDHIIFLSKNTSWRTKPNNIEIKKKN